MDEDSGEVKANLLKISAKLPAQRRWRKRPSEQGRPSHSSSAPVTMPGTRTTGCLGAAPARRSLAPGDSPACSAAKFGGMQWCRKSSSHHTVHKHPITQKHESTQLHLFRFLFPHSLESLPVFSFNTNLVGSSICCCCFSTLALLSHDEGSRKHSLRNRRIAAIASRDGAQLSSVPHGNSEREEKSV